MRVRGQKTLVSGRAGFLGSHWGDALIKRSDHVLCIDNFHTGTQKNLNQLLGILGSTRPNKS